MPRKKKQSDKNLQRAADASYALNAYSRTKTGKDAYDVIEDEASDLICDLMHLIRAHGVDPLAKLQTATINFEAEEAGEE